MTTKPVNARNVSGIAEAVIRIRALFGPEASARALALLAEQLDPCEYACVEGRAKYLWDKAHTTFYDPRFS